MAAMIPDLYASLTEAQVNSPSNVPSGKLFERLCEAVLLEAHDAKLDRHPGCNKTSSLLSNTLWWSTLRQDVGNYIESCPVCQYAKPSRSLLQGLLQSLPIPETLWTHISMDFIVELAPFKWCTVFLVVKTTLVKFLILFPSLPPLCLIT